MIAIPTKRGVSWIWMLIWTIFSFSCGKYQEAPIPSQKPFEFFVAGHLYGNQEHADTSLQPFPNFLNEISDLQQNPLLDFGVLLGDQVQAPEVDRYEALFQSLQLDNFSNPQFKLFAVPGNHDTSWDGGTALQGPYDDYFGPRFHSFRHKSALFLFLDSNEHHWRIQDSQLDMIKREIAEYPVPKATFIFVHNILWWESDPDSLYHYPTPNSNWNRIPTVNFHSEILPLLNAIPGPVYCFAGDSGANCNGKELTFRTEGNVHLISTGMGCSTHSHYLQVELDEEGNTNIFPRGIGTIEMGEIEDWSY